MKTSRGHGRNRAMTMIEVMLVVGLLGLAFAIVVGVLGSRPARARPARINCVSNLKQIGLALRMWSNDHAEKYPWQVSITQTGTLEFAESIDVYRHFLAVSNELSSPKVLKCFTDERVSPVTDWSKLRNRNLSYLVGLDSNETQPQSILSGDRNIGGGLRVTNGVMRFTNDSPAAFGSDIHHLQGNIGLGDGSAQQVTDMTLRKQIQSALLGASAESLRLSLPKPN